MGPNPPRDSSRGRRGAVVRRPASPGCSHGRLRGFGVARAGGAGVAVGAVGAGAGERRGTRRSPRRGSRDGPVRRRSPTCGTPGARRRRQATPWRARGLRPRRAFRTSRRRCSRSRVRGPSARPRAAAGRPAVAAGELAQLGVLGEPAGDVDYLELAGLWVHLGLARVVSVVGFESVWVGVMRAHVRAAHSHELAADLFVCGAGGDRGGARGGGEKGVCARACVVCVAACGCAAADGRTVVGPGPGRAPAADRCRCSVAQLRSWSHRRCSGWSRRVDRRWGARRTGRVRRCGGVSGGCRCRPIRGRQAGR
jgi:hypothetical protein